MDVFEFNAQRDIGYKTYNVVYEKYEDFEPIIQSFSFEQKSIKNWWQPLEITWIDNHNKDIYSTPNETLEGDISYCNSLPGGILFSQNAVTILQSYLQNTVEFLPLKLHNKFLFVMKVLKFFDIEDILDMNKSKITWSVQTQKQKDMGISKQINPLEYFLPYFNENMLKDILIFKINPSRLFDIYATEMFLDIINKNKFTGAAFKKIYPFPDSSDIRRAAYEKAMNKRKKR
jgi:hypothetical protein